MILLERNKALSDKGLEVLQSIANRAHYVLSRDALKLDIASGRKMREIALYLPIHPLPIPREQRGELPIYAIPSILLPNEIENSKAVFLRMMA